MALFGFTPHWYFWWLWLEIFPDFYAPYWFWNMFFPEINFKGWTFQTKFFLGSNRSFIGINIFKPVVKNKKDFWIRIFIPIGFFGHYEIFRKQCELYSCKIIFYEFFMIFLRFYAFMDTQWLASFRFQSYASSLQKSKSEILFFIFIFSICNCSCWFME